MVLLNSSWVEKEFENSIIRKADTFTLPIDSLRTVIDFSKKLTGYIWED